ncbi:hypothetical protein ACJBU6_03137 [Exserohilum turcicum]
MINNIYPSHSPPPTNNHTIYFAFNPPYLFAFPTSSAKHYISAANQKKPSFLYRSSTWPLRVTHTRARARARSASGRRLAAKLPRDQIANTASMYGWMKG